MNCIITLEEINQTNRQFYKAFETAFFENLNKYQSRIYPNENAEKLLWYYIKTNGEYIGCVWLEKEENQTYAVLGIFIAYESHRNQGFGSKAIRLMLDKAVLINVDEVHLNVRENNIRAINCYRNIGFVETEKYETDKGIAAIKMVYRI